MASKEITHDGLVKKFKEAKYDAEQFLRNLDEHTAMKRPDATTWCAVECYDHLVKTGQIYLKLVQEAMEESGQTKNEKQGTFSTRLHVRLMIDSMEPPYTMKMNTFSDLVPERRTRLDKKSTMQEFLKLQDDFIAFLNHYRGFDLDAVTITSPFASFLKFRIHEAVLYIQAHQRRHMWQAKQVIDEL